MPIAHHRGDLLQSPCTIIAHGCNCFNTMNSGIAKAIRAKHPRVYEVDSITNKGDKQKLGHYTLCTLPELVVFNLYTQYRYGRDKVHLDYGALGKALTHMKIWLDAHDPQQQETVGLPRIGCGLAGGEWGRVEAIINTVFPKRIIRIYTL